MRCANALHNSREGGSTHETTKEGMGEGKAMRARKDKEECGGVRGVVGVCVCGGRGPICDERNENKKRVRE